MLHSDKSENARRNRPTHGRAEPAWSLGELDGILESDRSYAFPIASTFQALDFPRAGQFANTAANMPHLQSAEFENPEMQSLKTFIVEDSPVIRESLIATLEELVPVDVVGTAEDESTAVSWLGRAGNQADLIIVDIFLKAGSGLGVIRAAHALSRNHTLVVLSNYATEDIRKKCLELGADRVFDKSNEIDALIDYCANLAAGNTGRGNLGPAE